MHNVLEQFDSVTGI